MYIKQVIISGFRSFKSQPEIEALSPRNNVIVGRNGSGKSNFFKAIQFVLLNERFQTLRQEQRQQLLHEGAGANVMSAFVEIVFDNSDGRLNQDGDEVTLRRTIGLKKDEFFLNRKRVNKQEVTSLLESAGFSKSNPYYIVQQGKMAALAVMEPEERLRLLEEVAGTTVYEERRVESLAIMEETATRREKIQEVVNYIEERLTGLKDEKEELGTYQQLDKERRALEYTLYDKELRKARDELAATEQAQRDELEEVNGLHGHHNQVIHLITDKEKACHALAARLEKVEQQKTEAEEERQDAIALRARLELEVKDVQDKVKADAETQEALQRELQALEQNIASSERELAATVEPAYATAVEAKRAAEQALGEAEAEAEELYAKRSRGSQFETAEERDASLRAQITSIEASLADKRRAVDSLHESIHSLEAQIAQSGHNTAEVESEIQQRHEQIATLTNKLKQKTAQRNDLAEERKERWRQLEKLDDKRSELRGTVQKSEGSLRASMPRHIALGLKAVEDIVKSEGITGYHGPFMENFKLTQSKFAKAVEVAAGNALFNVIVDSDDIAARLMKKLHDRRAGRLTFMPLNRLRDKQRTLPKYPDSNKVVSLIGVAVTFEDPVRAAIYQVFAKKLLAENHEAAAHFAKEAEMDCITLEGDEVGRKGSLTGGFRDERTNRLLAFEALQEARQGLTGIAQEYTSLQEKITQTDQAVTNVMGEIEKVEAQRATMRNIIDQKATELGAAKRARKVMMETVQAQKEQLPGLQAEVQQLELKRDMLGQEIGTPLQSELTPQEQARLTDLNGNIVLALRAKHADTFAALERAAEAKTRLTSLLTNNYRKRKEEVRELLTPEHGGVGSSTASIEQQQRAEALVSKQQALTAAERQLEDNRERLSALENEYLKGQQELRLLQDELEKLQGTETTETERVNEASKTLEKLENKRRLLQQKREDSMQKIQELGSLPSTELSKHAGLSVKQLMKKVQAVNEKLKKYQHVNKKALDQYVSFNEQRSTLLDRKKELDQGAKAIEDLIEALDRQKDEAILRTFKGVSHNFKQVFTELVPGGLGELIMKTEGEQRAGESEEEDDDDDEEDGSDEDDEADGDVDGDGKARKRKRTSKGKGKKGKSSGKGKGKEKGKAKGKDPTKGVQLNKFVGVQIRVTFPGSGKAVLMSQLSGGQKALVSLALIFAIQRCDPAPFYLFDEIDEALDPSYRAAVAALIEKQAQSEKNPTQFITTTFKPEMVRVAAKCFGVEHQNKVSNINPMTNEEALDFIVNEMQKEEEVGRKQKQQKEKQQRQQQQQRAGWRTSSATDSSAGGSRRSSLALGGEDDDEAREGEEEAEEEVDGRGGGGGGGSDDDVDMDD